MFFFPFFIVHLIITIVVFILILSARKNYDDYPYEELLDYKEWMKYVNSSSKLTKRNNLEFKGVHQCEVVGKKHYYTTNRYGRRRYTFILLIRSLHGNYEGFCYVSKDEFTRYNVGSRLNLGVVTTLNGEEVYFIDCRDEDIAIPQVVKKNRPFYMRYKILSPIFWVIFAIVFLCMIFSFIFFRLTYFGWWGWF